MITRKIVAGKINNYLQHNISLSDLVSWAENIMIDENFEEKYFEQIRDVVSRLGIADVKNFGLLWEDFEQLLNKLDYKVNIQLYEKVN